ncbi:MAG: cytochrome c oxidase subunit 3 [Bacteroidota bacterium]
MADVSVDKKALIEGERPIFNASYGKLMMWFFLVSDAFTFSALLIFYGSLRIMAGVDMKAWAYPEDVFTHAPILHEVFHIDAPLVFVGIMTFILILSSVTMVLAVEAGHRKAKKEVAKWVLATIIGGATFLGCQAYEWYHFIHGSYEGAMVVPVSSLGEQGKGIPGLEADASTVKVYPVKGIKTDDDLKSVYKDPKKDKIVELRVASNGYPITEGRIVKSIETEWNKVKNGGTSSSIEITSGGANLLANEYGPQGFAALFFFVTGFHGTHVLSGVVLLIILLINVNKGTYERRGHYEMTEKIGLYWHFVDLVWVFVFTFFYLI